MGNRYKSPMLRDLTPSKSPLKKGQISNLVDRLTNKKISRMGDKNNSSMLSQRKYKTTKLIGNGRLLSSKMSSSNIKTPSEIENSIDNVTYEPKSPTFSK